jgi:hypothetical protein
VSEPRLSKATRELLRAAKNDAPTAAARTKIWSNVGSVAGTAAGAASVGTTAAGAAGGSLAPGAIAGTAGASKMLALGTLLGGTITVGLAAALLRIGPAPSDVPLVPSAPLAAATAGTFAAPPPPSLAPAIESASMVGNANPPVASALPVAAHAPAPAMHAIPAPSVATVAHMAASVDDTLSREAALVAEARGAIVRGDPQAALRSIHAARQLPSRQLLPEELAVEAQAYRALGREDEAHDADTALKKQFPESALAR